MADISTQINGEPVTLIDNGDGTYRIDLASQDARKFVRGELKQLRATYDQKKAERDILVGRISVLADQRQSYIAEATALQAEIDALKANADELIAWLQSQGDPTAV